MKSAKLCSIHPYRMRRPPLGSRTNVEWSDRDRLTEEDGRHETRIQGNTRTTRSTRGGRTRTEGSVGHLPFFLSQHPSSSLHPVQHPLTSRPRTASVSIDWGTPRGENNGGEARGGGWVVAERAGESERAPDRGMLQN
jgi:hypothetical protein